LAGVFCYYNRVKKSQGARKGARYETPAQQASQQNAYSKMQRTNPNFKQHFLSDLEQEEFLDELFANLFDLGDITSDTDKVPDFRILTRS